MNERRAQIDTSVQIVTPENIAFQYWLAGPSRRFPAYLLDVIFQVLALALLVLASALLFGTLGFFGLIGTYWGLMMLLVFVVHWFYGGIFEALWNGQTPGKRIMGIRVVTTQGQPLRPWQAVLRNILRAVDAMPLLPLPLSLFDVPGEIGIPVFIVGFVSASLNDRFQRLGDLATGTMVIMEQQSMGVVLKFRDERVARMAESIPPSFQVGRTLGVALSHYVQRREVLSRARRKEIARYLGEELCERFKLPKETDHDLLLCGLYQKAFLGEPSREEAIIL
jgi:uncharacterized RDD family membrane protein YckC